MGSLLARAASQQALLDAWGEIRDNALEDGDAGKQVEAFEKDAALRISRISSSLLDGTWEPSPVVHVLVPKRDGVRHLGIPSVEDRIVDRSVKDVLDEFIDPLLMPWSVAYRRGLSVHTAVGFLLDARDEGRGWVARCDIKDCFESISRSGVLRRLYEVCADHALCELIRLLVHRPLVGRSAPRLRRDHGLHQGSPLSPLLANLYLDALDRDLVEAGYIPVRYADDIAVPVRDRVDGERALSLASAAARRIGLALNDGKSEVKAFDSGVSFLGQTLTNRSGPGRDELAHPLETTIYVERQGALLRSRGDRAVVEAGDEVLARVNFRRTREFVLHGRVGMTSHFLAQALQRGKRVVLTAEDGRYVGQFEPLVRASPHLRLAQYRTADHPGSALKGARPFVLGKLQNQRVLLLRYARGREVDLTRHIEVLESCHATAAGAASNAALMGAEGAGSRAYFSALPLLLPREWQFTQRVRRPPPDPINSMLSFGYTLLGNEGVAAASAAGLDPSIGFLHRPRNGRYSAALDLIEELRPVVVDTVVLTLVTKRMVSLGDFDFGEEFGCRLTQTGRRIFISAYERRMLRLMTYLDTGRRISYRVALHMQAKSLARALTVGEAYRPILWK